MEIYNISFSLTATGSVAGGCPLHVAIIFWHGNEAHVGSINHHMNVSNAGSAMHLRVVFAGSMHVAADPLAFAAETANHMVMPSKAHRLRTLEVSATFGQHHRIGCTRRWMHHPPHSTMDEGMIFVVKLGTCIFAHHARHLFDNLCEHVMEVSCT